MAEAVSVLRQQGNAHFCASDFLKAAGDFTKALKLAEAAGDAVHAEDKAALLSNRSASFAALGKARQALADADAAAALRPTWDKAHYRRGVALEVRASAAGQRGSRLPLGCPVSPAAESSDAPQLLGRRDEARSALEQSAQLSGGPNPEVARRLRALRGEPGTPAAGGLPAKASAFAFAAAASASEEKGGRWLTPGSVTELQTLLLTVLPQSPTLVDALLASPSAPAFAQLALDASAALPAAEAAAAWTRLQPALLSACASPDCCLALLQALEAARGGARARARRRPPPRSLCPGRPGTLPLPPPSAPAMLVSAARCAGEEAAVRRAALEACNSVFLAAAKCGAAAWEAPPLAPLLSAGLADACLSAASAASAELREAACGVLHNVTTHAMRAWAAEGALERAAAPAAERLCMLLDRPGNPLDDAEVGDAEAHAFLAPIAALLADGPPALLGRLGRAKLLAEALAAATGGGAEALAGAATLVLLLERPGELRALAGAEAREAFRGRREELAGSLLRVASASAELLRLRPSDG